MTSIDVFSNELGDTFTPDVAPPAPVPSPAPAPVPSPAAAARRPGDAVERLLEEVEAVAGPVTWPHVEALVAALVELYGEGLARTLACARDAASGAGHLDELLARDELVASLLLLHDLHPLALELRIETALARVRIELPAAAHLVLATVEDGIAKLKVAADAPATARPPPTTIVAREIEREAPEIAGVQIDSAVPPSPSDSAFVPVERLLRGGRP